MRDPDRLREELAQARAEAAYWEREAVLRSVAVSGALFDQIALARALARNVEAFMTGARSAIHVQRSLDAFWRSAKKSGRPDSSG
jgi:hypothetical protein